jgi:DNA modification methylase
VSITLHLGDCLEYMRSLPDGCVDAVVTDPPWMAYTTGWYDASEWHRPIGKVAPEEYASPCYRLLRDGGAMLLWCRWDVFHEHACALREAGFAVRNQIVWAKPNHTAGDLTGNVGNKHECAIFATKGRWERHDRREVNLWQESHLFSRDKRHHPTEKPVGLMQRSVNLCCPPDGVTLDPFMGSGTTGVACVQTGRRFIGCEIDSGYFEIAKRRIEQAQPALLEIA